MVEPEQEEKFSLEDKEEANKESGEEFEDDEIAIADVTEESDEDQVKEEISPVKKRRCQRKKKIRQICFDNEDADEEEELDLFYEEEDEEGEGEEEEETDIVSYGSSVLSAVTFIWENEVYEFEELCDPGNIETIFRKFHPEPELIDEAGIHRYLQVCGALKVTPMIRLLRSLTTKSVDLSYRNIDSGNIRSMCAALENNNVVESLILRFNKLRSNDCFYIGLILHNNEKISLLDFTGCRVGPEGLQLLIAYLPRNETVLELNLSKCNIMDEGMKLIAYVIARNNSLQKLDLSYNKLEAESAEALGLAFKMNSSITDLNLRYNNLFDPFAMKAFFRSVSANNSLSRLDLSWNGLSGVQMGELIGSFLRRNGSIQYLDFSDNRFEGLAVMEIKKGLSRSRSLKTLKLGKNPMTPEDLETLLSGAKGCSSLTVLDLEDLWVKKSFVKALKKLQQDRDIEVIFAGIYSNYEIYGPDYPKIILQRAQFEAMKPKSVKKRKDFGHFIWTLGDEPLTQDEFMTRVKKFKAKISKELFPELMKQFIIPKVQLLDVVAMKKKYLSIFPDSTPPPPPKIKPKKGKQADDISVQQETTENEQIQPHESPSQVAGEKIHKDFEDFTELNEKEHKFALVEEEEFEELENFEALIISPVKEKTGEFENEEEENKNDTEGP